MIRSAHILLLLLLPIACNRPPVGLYETRVVRDVTYAERADRELAMDIVLPVEAAGLRPAILWLHGGAWAHGWRGLMEPLAKMTASLGYVSATAEYRLTTSGVTFPAPALDAVEAVRFLLENASQYNVNPDKLVIGGESAGAHLAMVAGLTRGVGLEANSERKPIHVVGIINIYGPTDLGLLFDAADPPTRGFLEKFVGCPRETCPETWRNASPALLLDDESPPTLILHGDADSIVPFSQAEHYADCATRNGAICHLGRVPRAEHGWIYFSHGDTCLSTLPLIAQFMERVCREASPVPVAADRRRGL